MLHVYKASAGSGKTFTLAKKYINLLFDPKREKVFRNILAVTFTNKATEEMKSRIVKELHTLAENNKSDYLKDLKSNYNLSDEQVQQKAKKILSQLLFDYSSFSVSTIDKFFQQIIRSFAREIGVNGSYQLELDSALVLEQAVDNLFIELNNPDNKQLLQWLIQYAEEQIEDGKSWNIRKNIHDTGREIFKESYQHKAEETQKKLHDKAFLDSYKRKLKGITENFTNELKFLGQKGLGILAENGLQPSDSSRNVLNYFEKIQNKIEGPGKTFVECSSNVEKCYTKASPSGLKDKFQNAYQNGLQKVILDILDLFESQEVHYHTAKLILNNLHSLGILTDLAVELRKLTADENIMLIADSNLLLNKIIDNSETPFVYEKTGMKIDNFMIDEFQDTSGLQWENFLPLIKNSMASGLENMVVGDVKQSIYRWRNSDWRLLQHQINEDFRKDELINSPLLDNWRSDEHIVEFNNTFFTEASNFLQSKLNILLDEAGKSEKLEALTSIIQNAYSDVSQNPAKKNDTGYVRIEFIENVEDEENEDEESESNSKNKWKLESLRRTVRDVEELQSRGFTPGDICILVRDKKDERLIVEHFLAHKNSGEALKDKVYDLVSQEGLLINLASSVRFITAVLHLILNHEDKIHQLIVESEALKLKIDTDEIHEKIEKTESLGQVSLFEITEHLIREFGLGRLKDERIFLQSFQDVVFKFSTSKSADLNSFIQWWDAKSGQQFISVPESMEAVRIMTIHKSKGLDFGAVIVPFLSWELDNSHRPLIWVPMQDEPYNELPLIPILYSSGMGKSLFAEQYFQEMMQNYVDNINLAYVAFTRPKHELIAYSPMPKKPEKGEIKLNSIGVLAYKVAENQGTDKIEKGNKHKPEKDNKEKFKQINLNTYPSVEPGNRLRLKHNLMMSSMETDWDNPIGHGTMMHELLQRIQVPEDAENALDGMYREGKIGREEMQTMRLELEDFWKMEGVKEWFDPKYSVLNERSILTPDGSFYRPDRIIIENNKALVIDYKFGENELVKHRKQVTNYKQLLEEMGYETRAFLCYVALKKVLSL